MKYTKNRSKSPHFTVVFGKSENQPWRVKFSVEDFSCHEIKFGGNKIMFDLFRREKTS